MSNRDQIRSKTVGAQKVFGNETVMLGDVAVVVRQPTVEERAALIEASATVDPKTKEIKPNIAKLHVNSVIVLTCVPDADGKPTDEKVFEEADRESMLKTPASAKWFSDLTNAAQRMLNVDLDDAKNG